MTTVGPAGPPTKKYVSSPEGIPGHSLPLQVCVEIDVVPEDNVQENIKEVLEKIVGV